jgi:hypothetical protein
MTTSQNTAATLNPAGARSFRPGLIMASVIVLAVSTLTMACGTSASASATTEPRAHLVPQELKIVGGRVSVEAGKTLTYRVDVEPNMVAPHLKGSFMASGGTGNDIQVAIADSTNMTNWMNGHQALTVWETPGKQTAGDIDVPLKPGTYYVAFSNSFSVVTDKNVDLDVSLHYSALEQDNR